MYPIKKFVNDRIKELGISKNEVVRRTGYTNISKGLRRLEQFLINTDTAGLVAPRLHKALEIPFCELEAKVIETRKIIKEKYEAEYEESLRQRDLAARAVYAPHLALFMERAVPTQICICGFTGGDSNRFIFFPKNFNELPTEEQNQLIQEKVDFAMNRFEQKGTVRFFGKIQWFVLSRYYDEPQEDRNVYDLEGNLISDATYAQRIIRNGVASVSLKRSRVDVTNMLGRFSKEK